MSACRYGKLWHGVLGKRRTSRDFPKDRYLEMQMIELYRGFGFWRGTAILAGCLVLISPWVILDIWLSEEIDWPRAYGFSCGGRGCRFTQLWHSPMLLGSGNAYELAMFALLWSMPVLFAGITIAIGFVRYRKRRRDRILPMDY